MFCQPAPTPEWAARIEAPLAELFHLLSQPLSGLQCSLEVALLQDRTKNEYQDCLHQALLQARRVIAVSEVLRDLVCEPCIRPQPSRIPLAMCLGWAIADLQPCADFKDVRLHVGQLPNFLVHGRSAGKAFFHLLDYLLTRSAVGSQIEIGTLSPHGQSQILLMAELATGDSPAWPGRNAPTDESIAIEIARVLLAEDGVDFSLNENPGRISIALHTPAGTDLAA
jgi:hypothetical protein